MNTPPKAPSKVRYALLPLLLLAGCATLPDGPRVAVMPAPGKPFDLFVHEERACRAFAAQSLGTTPNELAARNVAGTTIVGTAVGAAAGALAGGHNGAGAGAAVGMVAGTAAGASDARYAGADAQRRYDIAYQQCMYAKGNQLPGAYGYGGYGYRPATPYGTAQPGYSVPPPNYPPPPPLRRE